MDVMGKKRRVEKKTSEKRSFNKKAVKITEVVCMKTCRNG
jgi:hypothetical protein